MTAGRDCQRRLTLLGFCLASLLAAAPTAARADAGVPFIDTHAHIVRSLQRKGSDIDRSAEAALALMDRLGVTLVILSPPPFPPDWPGAYGLVELQALVRAHPGRFAYIAGGESLNPMIMATPAQSVTPTVLREFQQESEAIARGGAAGFGEIAAEHFSARIRRHPYEWAPPDHPLLLALADIAAENGLPIELHMEAVPRDMSFPNASLAGPPNPPALKENISALERLLDHNLKARIVWVHAGWDLSGERTVDLMRSLLEKHANLYMSLKIDIEGNEATSPLLGSGQIKPEWVALLRRFHDRFVIGSDQFFDQGPARIGGARNLVDALPPDLARAIGSENVERIYRVSTAP